MDANINESEDVFLHWNAHFETGIPIVDVQHKRLVELLNTLASHIAELSDDMELNEVFNELAAYADYHFKTEEDVWHPYFKEDSSFLEHQKIHQSFIQNVVDLKEEETNKPIEVVMEDILGFLTNWLGHHILGSDKRMALTIHAMETGMSLGEAKQKADEDMASAQLLTDTILDMTKKLSTCMLELMKEKAARESLNEMLNVMLESSSDPSSD